MVPPVSSPQARRLTVSFATRRMLLSASRTEGGTLSMDVPTPEWLPDGTPVTLDLVLAGLDRRVLTGTVGTVPLAAWMRNGRLMPVYFEGEAKRSAAELIAFCAGRPPEMGTAQRPRFPTVIRCRVRAGSRRLPGRVLDLSTTGAFVALATQPSLRVGETVQVALGTNVLGLGGHAVDARVMWCGAKDGAPGMGVRFLGDQVHLGPVLRPFLEGARTAGA
jgi:hypothetical protein